MVRFGAPEAQARRCRRRRRRPRPTARATREERRRLVASSSSTTVRPRVAPRRPGARPHRLHRRRPRPLEGHLLRPLRRSRRRQAQKDSDKGFLAKLLTFWKTDEKDKPEQYRIKVVETAPHSIVTVQDPNGAPDRTQASEKILALLRTSSSSVGRVRRCASRHSAVAAKATASSSKSGGTRVLIDCGFGVRDTVARLARLGVAPESITAILVTHEHADHIGGVAGVRRALRHPGLAHVRHAGRGRRALRRHRRASTASTATTRSRSATLEVRPFPVPHDAREPVQFVVGDGEHRARRADRHRHVDALRRSEPVAAATRWCSNATTISTCWRAATIRGRSSSASSGRLGHLHNEAAADAAGGARHVAAAAHHRRASVAAEQHARQGARRARAGARLRARLDRHRRPGRRASRWREM